MPVILLATTLMVAGMWVSKTLQPLWFAQEGHLRNFGLSTTAMAIAGLSAFWSHKIVAGRSVGGVLTASCLAYATGLALRVFVNSALVAIASGLIAGLGASMFLAAVRIDVARQPTEQRLASVSAREAAIQVGTVIGTLLAAGLAAVVGRSLWIGLLVAPTLLIAAAVVGRRVGRPADSAPPPPEEVQQSSGPMSGRSRVVGVWALRGFAASLVIPYLPLLLEDRGVARSAIGVVLAAAAVGRLFALRLVPLLDRHLGTRRSAVVSELLLALLTLALVPAVGATVVIAAVLLRFAVTTFTTVVQDLVLFSMASPIALVGTAQAAFLIGDAAAGLVAPGLWLGGGEGALLIAVGLLFVTAICNTTAILPQAREREPAPA
ncbi:MFS transporter [Patulibacter sp. NPDC049589]|uniref:MFS transporter n=1 Tax=Patulibacter sp. NPDC049589 TaxID=3154731 RepID=UPI0034234C36